MTPEKLIARRRENEIKQRQKASAVQVDRIINSYFNPWQGRAPFNKSKSNRSIEDVVGLLFIGAMVSVVGLIILLI